MATTGVAPPPNPGVAYTKRLRIVQELHLLFLFLGVILYGSSPLHPWALAQARDLVTNFYVQLALCVAPLWIVAGLGLLFSATARYFLDRKFGLAKSSLWSRLLETAKASFIGFLLNCSILEITFASQLKSPSLGWIWAASLCSLLLLGIVNSIPWLLSLFYPLVPLADAKLHDRLTQLGEKAGVKVGQILEWRIATRTRQANALVSGIGGARRILVTDTLLSELSGEEVEAIIAHELGHCALHHIAKRSMLRWALYLPIFWLINASVTGGLLWFADRATGWRNLQLVPAIFLCWQTGNIYGNLLIAAMSRKQEREADQFGWKLMETARPFIPAMRKLAALNLIVFDKGSQWKYMHPATPDRIAAAEQFEREIAEKDAASHAAASHGVI